MTTGPRDLGKIASGLSGHLQVLLFSNNFNRSCKKPHLAIRLARSISARARCGAPHYDAFLLGSSMLI